VRPEAVCIAARTNVQLDDRYGPILSTEGIQHVLVKRNPESEAKKPGIRIATMHRLKGLEFAKVMLVGVQDGQMPLHLGEHPDLASREDHELQERCLLYVAMTRARDEVIVTGFGASSPFLKPTERLPRSANGALQS
jgi:superfamily I DNA/RNA helicase